MAPEGGGELTGDLPEDFEEEKAAEGGAGRLKGHREFLPVWVGRVKV